MLNNLLELAVILISNNFESMAPKNREREVYVVVRDVLEASIDSVGIDIDIDDVFSRLAEIISNTGFAKKSRQQSCIGVC